MKLVVLGGSGFIGSRLVDQLLRQGHDVRNIDIAPSAMHADRTTRADVRDASAMREVLTRCEAVINLAAAHGDDVQPVSLYDEVNRVGAQNIVRAARENGVPRIVFVSSAAVYSPGQALADESSALLPATPYGCSKASAEAVYVEWANADLARHSLTMLRPCVVFGEGGRGNVHRLIEQIRRQRFVMIGRGSHRKSIAYVGNLVDFLCTQIDNPCGVHVCNYADQPDLTTRELVDMIRRLLPQGALDRVRVPYALALAAGYLLDAVALTRGRPAVARTRITKFCSDTRLATTTLARTGFRAHTSHSEALARAVAHAVATRQQ
ncbi:MAG: NAD(P)-dependent oxidoreductase [Dokdonella sp.]